MEIAYLDIDVTSLFLILNHNFIELKIYEEILVISNAIFNYNFYN
jgi:hypothetical protein